MALTTAGKQVYGFRDAKGQVSRVSFYVLFDGSSFSDAESAAGGMRAAIVALSNAALVSRRGFDDQNQAPNAYGAQSTYENVEDKAVLTLIASDNTLHRIQIPAPKSAIFTADGQTVDSANTNVAALVTALSATSGASGARVGTPGLATFSNTCLVGGVRVRRKLQRRMTIYTLSAKLDEPAE